MQKVIDHDNPDYPGWICIAGYDDSGNEVWRSWAPADIDPAIRLNIDHPTATDDRASTPAGEIAYRVPTVDEAAALDLGADQHRVIAAYATVTGAVVLNEAAIAAGLLEGDLIAEAEGWAAATSLD